MADTRKRFPLDPVSLRSESTKIVLSVDTAGEIKNFERTANNTLRSVVGPTKLLHYDGYDEDSYEDTALRENLPVKFVEGKKYGIFHARMPTGKQILLVHTETGIHEVRLNRRQSDKSVLVNLIGDSSKMQGSAWTTIASEDFVWDVPLEAEHGPQFPTQFELTDKGVVIVPQGFQRAYFYDGEVVLPLGYDSIPSPPIGLGPTDDAEGNPNRAGYVYHNSNLGPTTIGMFGGGRLGSLEQHVTDGEFRMLPSSYRCATQWMDHFGNLSPVSDRSAELRISSQKKSSDDRTGDDLLKAVLWDNVDPGPIGTVARRLYRTKDLNNARDGKLYFLSGNVGFASINSNASIPDNISTHFPDNSPDGWLSVPAETDVIPVPPFKLCRFSLGRLWIANTGSNPGAVFPSLPGRYGTFLSSQMIVPDPSSGEVTGLWSVEGGLLVFTRSSTFLVTPNTDGAGFRAATVSSVAGCVAPSSLASLPDGSVVWLGKEGFYKYSAQGVELLSGPIQEIISRINNPRALQAVGVFVPESQEYRCWVPVDGNTKNNLCLIYDTDGWRHRVNEQVSCACVTRDHRNYVLCGGQVFSGPGFTTTFTSKGDNSIVYDGYFIVDRENSFDWKSAPIEREYVLETAWVEWGRSKERRSVKTFYLSLVESHRDKIKVEVYRDWRKGKPVYAAETGLHSPEDIPPFWGEEKFGSDAEWVKRRPLWRRVDVSVPSCEVYKIRLVSKVPFEFIGLAIDEELKTGAGSRIP